MAPVMKIGRRVLRGFAEGQWNAALDDAGYPKTALVQITPVQNKPARAAPPIEPAQAPASDGEAMKQRLKPNL